MNHLKKILTLIIIIVSTQVFAQNSQDKLVGKWLTKDKATVEILKHGTIYSIRQLDAVNEKDKKDNGKIIGKSITSETDMEFKGIVVDPSNNKEYKAYWIVSGDGKTLTIKVKWGLINFSEKWQKL